MTTSAGPLHLKQVLSDGETQSQKGALQTDGQAWSLRLADF